MADTTAGGQVTAATLGDDNYVNANTAGTIIHGILASVNIFLALLTVYDTKKESRGPKLRALMSLFTANTLLFIAYLVAWQVPSFNWSESNFGNYTEFYFLLFAIPAMASFAFVVAQIGFGSQDGAFEKFFAVAVGLWTALLAVPAYNTLTRVAVAIVVAIVTAGVLVLIIKLGKIIKGQYKKEKDAAKSSGVKNAAKLRGIRYAALILFTLCLLAFGIVWSIGPSASLKVVDISSITIGYLVCTVALGFASLVTFYLFYWRKSSEKSKTSQDLSYVDSAKELFP